MKYIVLLACLPVLVACGDDDLTLPDASPADAGRDGGPRDGGPGDAGTDANDLVDAFLPDASTGDTGSDAGDADLDVGFDAATSRAALRFDGDAQVLVENNPFGDETEFTVEVWARFRGDGTRTQIIASNREFEGDSGFLLGYFGGDPLVQVFGTNLVGASFSISRFTWHHIAVVREATDLVTIYVDGVAAGSGTRTGSVATAAMLRIGSDAHTDTDLEGDVHDLRIWNVARTPEEIRSSMGSSTPLDAVGLLANWPMSEGSGQMVSDTAGAHPGVLGETPEVESRDPEWITLE